MKLSGPGFLFAGRFLITVSISVLVISLLRFSIFPGSVLESYTFLGIRPFLPSCPFYCHIVADNRRDMGFIPGLGRPPAGERGNPLQYSC